MSTESNEPVESEKAEDKAEEAPEQAEDQTEQAADEAAEEAVEEPAVAPDGSDKVIITQFDDDDDDDEASSKSWVKFVVVGVLALALIGAGVWAFTGGISSGWATGDCASIKLSAEGKTEATSESCGSDDGAYKVAKILNSDQETCPEEGLYETAPYDSKQLCLMPNFEEGKCYVPNDEGLFKKGGCTGEAVVKVVKKIDGKPEDPQCPEGSDGMPFTEPAVTFCLGTGDTP